ncbi:CLUMA_CG006041, isoform A [Clunio marinus]|uniref:Mitochondrial inner membrane protein Mpv17 n=1 Tax=Clunio marinus TaxID=568069 RepID=A0A1J1I0Y1_9DIPT|nr:CLUMA_CG006041, isoform A [Clunio marinus]
MSFLLRSYKKGVSRFPYIAQGVQASILMATGDAIAQIGVEKKTKFDFQRSSHFLLIGFFGGLGLRKWYGVLQSRFTSPNKTANTLKKVAVDQLFFAPAFIGALVGSVGLLQGQNPNDITKKLKREFPDILLANYKLWPAVQLLNFYFVPLNYQVVLVQVVAVLWNTYVSFKTNEVTTVVAESHS